MCILRYISLGKWSISLCVFKSSYDIPLKKIYTLFMILNKIYIQIQIFLLAQTHQQDMVIAQIHNEMWYKIYIICK